MSSPEQNDFQTLDELPLDAFCYGTASPDMLPAVAEAYRAGAELRATQEHVDWWSTQGYMQVADRLYRQGSLVVRPTRLCLASEVLAPITATAAIFKDHPSDVELWSDYRDTRQSLHVHRLATHPDFRGRREGEALLATIAYGSLCNAAQRPYLRLDCAAEAEQLRSFYEERIGLRCVGEYARHTGYRAALYEARLEEVVPNSWLYSSQRAA